MTETDGFGSDDLANLLRDAGSTWIQVEQIRNNAGGREAGSVSTKPRTQETTAPATGQDKPALPAGSFAAWAPALVALLVAWLVYRATSGKLLWTLLAALAAFFLVKRIAG
ncbi:MAG: hypothetical protein L6R43_18445 [Planctomycetes bacterium]|nr:hypothetical protein [Planctomycetota bacterium]